MRRLARTLPPAALALVPATLALLALPLAACDTGVTALAGWPDDDGGAAPVDAAMPATTSLPCDVQMVLASTCDSCHGDPTANGAPISLVTRDDLLKTSYADPKATFAERALVRMMAASAPMPPSPNARATDAQIKTISDWVAAGTPAGDCAAGDGGTGTMTAGDDPLNAASTCTSGTTWGFGDSGSDVMNPGKACITCHATRREGPSFNVAGTVYPSGHEPDLCNGGPQDSTLAQVVITDANHVDHTLQVDDVGNFMWESRNGTLATPFTAKVVYGAKVRAMSTAQTNGDCNSCHSERGANGAPGRITLPY